MRCACAVCCYMWHVELHKIISTLSYKLHDFRKKKNLRARKIFALIFSTGLSEKFLILRRNERDITINVSWSSCKVPIILVIF